MSMFGNMGGMFDLMKNAKQMMEKAKEAQAELAKRTVEGSAGAGLVSATMNGAGDLVGLRFDASAVDPGDPEMLADLVISAVADARKKLTALRAGMFDKVAGGVDLSPLGIDKSAFF